MKKLFDIIAAMITVCAAISGIVYLLQKKGVINVEVNYDDESGEPVTRGLDEIVDGAAIKMGEKVSETVSDVADKVGSLASVVKTSVSEQLEAVNEQLERKGITIPSSIKEHEYQKPLDM